MTCVRKTAIAAMGVAFVLASPAFAGREAPRKSLRKQTKNRATTASAHRPHMKNAVVVEPKLNKLGTAGARRDKRTVLTNSERAAKSAWVREARNYEHSKGRYDMDRPGKQNALGLSAIPSLLKASRFSSNEVKLTADASGVVKGFMARLTKKQRSTADAYIDRVLSGLDKEGKLSPLFVGALGSNSVLIKARGSDGTPARSILITHKPASGVSEMHIEEGSKGAWLTTGPAKDRAPPSATISVW